MAKRTTRNRPLSKRQQRARRNQWIVMGGIAAVVVVIVAVVTVVLSRDEPGQKIADLGNDHLSAEPTSYLWNSRPPTSGPHASQIASWGEHTDTVPEWYQVHNLEDGGVIMHYNCPDGCPEMVAELRDILNDVGTDGVILHPYTDMDNPIAVTAWTRLLVLDAVDRDQIVEFIEAYRGVDHHRQ